MSIFCYVRDLPSLTRNGSFGSGLAFWEIGPDVLHAQIDSGQVASSSLLNSPTFHAEIPSGSWIRQVIARQDLYFYPGIRQVANADALAVSSRTFIVRPSFATTVDGVPWNASNEPFVYEDAEGVVSITFGEQITVEDLLRSENSGAYRVGRLITDADGVRSVQVSPINGNVPSLTSDADFTGALYVRDVGLNFASITLFGVNSAVRSDGQTAGIQPGDVFVSTAPQAAAGLVVQVTNDVDQTDLIVVAVPGAAFFDETGSTQESITDWFVSPLTRFSLSRSLDIFQYDLTLAFSHYPHDYDGEPQLEIVDQAGRVLHVIPSVALESGSAFEILSNSDDLSGAGTVFRRRLYRFFSEQRRPFEGFLRLTIPAGSRDTNISDVVLYRGNFTRRHDISDLDDDGLTVVADRRSSLDRLVHGVDEYESTIPRGAIFMYAGGAQCPPGFKRVDSFRNSEVDGFELLPYPSSIEYDATRNRTLIRWISQSFDLLDLSGKTIPVVGDSTPSFVALPATAPFNGAYEIVTVGPVQQRIQPGMSVRVRTSTLPGANNRRFDYSVPIRQVVVDRSELAGPAPGDLGALHAITYPLFMTDAQFLNGERAFNPSGPPAASQPTAYASTNVSGSPVGTLGNKASFSGLVDGASTMTISGVTLTPLAVGEVVYVRWQAASVSAIYGFIAVITGKMNQNITVRRYDNRGIVTDQQLPLAGDAWFSNALVFDSAVTINRTFIGTQVVWSARRYRNDCVVSVFGDVVNDLVRSNTQGILIEPSGFIRSGDPGAGIDYGTMGHSHKIGRGDAPYNENLAPHVSLQRENLPSTVVARQHGHGYLARHAHVIPEFAAFLLCEKL